MNRGSNYSKQVEKYLWTLMLLMVSCASPKREFSQDLEAFILDKDNDILVMKNITNFPWDRFYAFKPRTSPETIHKRLGFEWEQAQYSGLLQYNTYVLLVFVKDKSVLFSLKYQRQFGDFIKLKKTRGYNPDEAVFIIDRTAGWLSIRDMGTLPDMIEMPRATPQPKKR